MKEVINAIGRLNGYSHTAKIKDELLEGRALVGMPNALQERGTTADRQGLQVIHFQHAEQNKNKVHRHGSGDTRQADLHAGRRATQ